MKYSDEDNIKLTTDYLIQTLICDALMTSLMRIAISYNY